MDCIVHGVAKSQTRLSDFTHSSGKKYVLKNESINFQCNLTGFCYKGKSLISIQVKTKNRFLRKNTTMKPALGPSSTTSHKSVVGGLSGSTDCDPSVIHIQSQKHG